jgi:hypothetical protein
MAVARGHQQQVYRHHSGKDEANGERGVEAASRRLLPGRELSHKKAQKAQKKERRGRGRDVFLHGDYDYD